MPAALEGLVVLSFESRRSEEAGELIRRHGGTPVLAPSMREIPLQKNAESLALLTQLERSQLDLVIFLTGVGLRTLVASLGDRCPPSRFAELLRNTRVAARGPKPVAALRELGVTPNITAPEPNTWRELLLALDAAGPLAGKRVAIQEYGMANDELIAALGERGAEVQRVPVYRWGLPLDTGPLYAAVRRLADHDCHAAMFTSATQVDHVALVAREIGKEAALAKGACRVVIASIGPICREALERHGLPVDIEPAHPKLGHLVAALAKDARQLWNVKSARNPL